MSIKLKLKILNNFKIKSDVVVSFENDELELIDCVSFCELITYFQLGEKPTSLLDYTPYKPVIIENSLFRGKNKSFCRFKLKLIRSLLIFENTIDLVKNVNNNNRK